MARPLCGMCPLQLGHGPPHPIAVPTRLSRGFNFSVMPCQCMA